MGASSGVTKNHTAAAAIAAAKAEPSIAKEIAGKTVCKEIYVPGKLVNIAVK